ncbi:hypothetical protein [Cellulomonas hominis]
MNVPARSSGPGPHQAPGTDDQAPAPSTAVPGDRRDEGTEGAAGSAAPVLVAPPSPEELVDSALATWRAALVEAAGGSTLADVELLGEAALDLSAAHPSGIAQLFAGRETRLSNLVREGSALTAAKRRARSVGARASTYAQQFGIAPTYLAIAVATWTERTTPDIATDDVAALASATRGTTRGQGPTGDARTGAAGRDTDDEHAPSPSAPPTVRRVRAPVLLRPVSLRARGAAESDYELTLEPSLEVNPVLARALRSRGALLDAGAVARGAFTGSGFDPRPALSRLTALGDAVLEDFELAERLVVGTFVHPGQVLVDDLDSLAGGLERHEVVAALAGVTPVRDELHRPLPELDPGDRDPGLERGAGDLDTAQRHVLDVIATGRHLFVDAPTGSDVTGTLAAVVADAAAAGRTVLYVPGHRRAAAALEARLDRLGLADLMIDVAPDAGWRSAAARRLLAAMTLEAEQVDVAWTQALRRELVAHREQLRAYIDALHAERAPWGVSAYDALQSLARLTSARPTPRTTVRLDAGVARVLDDRRRAEVAAELVRAAELGAFTLRTGDTPWLGADLRTEAAAIDVLHRVERLLGDGPTGLAAVRARVLEVAETTGFIAAGDPASWGEQLAVLDGIRGVLDAFQPIVFERSPADLIAATATKAWRAERGVSMGYWLRRRLRKQARDMVRPGRPVADLHGGLIDVEEQRRVWQAHCPAGGWPRLPEGLTSIATEYRAAREDLEAVGAVLVGTSAGGDLLHRPWAETVERLTRLLADRAALDTLPERTRLVRSLTSTGLGDLLADLADRRVGPGLVGAELDLAWWSTVFEQVLAADPALAGYDGTTLGQIAAEYATLDRAHVDGLSVPLRGAVIGHVRTALAAHPEQAEGLFAELVEERLTSLRETFGRYPDIARRLRPVLAASPMLVPQVLPPTRTVDLVVLDAATQLSVEVALPAIARGRQIVVVGDMRSASASAVRELAQALPVVALRSHESRRDPYLTAFLAAHGYAGVLSPTPLPQKGPLVRLDLVAGTGMPDAATGVVPSTRAEVDHVVELAITHALTRPDESLAVVTASALHAQQVREALLGEVRDNPGLAAFFDAGRTEPFVVSDLTSVTGLSRDAVILSLGFGRTPHGRVLHRFGPISGPGGDALLLDALGSTRHRLDVVSCFGLGDLDAERLRGPGPRLLADLLDFAARRGADRLTEDDVARWLPRSGADGGLGTGLEPGPQVDGPEASAAVPAGATGGAQPVVRADAEPDRLVVDLAERLWRHGLVVEVDHGLPGGTRIPLAVGHPDRPDELLVAVLTDDDAYVAEPSIRVRDRQLAGRLERLGWHVVQVWSAAAFLDPQAEVDRIRRAVHACLPVVTRPAPTGAVPLVAEVQDDEPLVGAEGDVAAVGAGPAGTPADGVPGETASPAAPGAEVAPTPPAAPASGPTRTPVRAPLSPTWDQILATGEQLTLAVPDRPRPDVRSGLPISAYSDDQLDEIVAWLISDGTERSRDQLAAAVRSELGIKRRSSRVDSVVAGAVRRATPEGTHGGTKPVG